GRGYVVRKILRRAVRDGIELGLAEPFLAALLAPVRQVLEPTYPELGQQAGTIETFVQGEEERFRELYQRGIRRLEGALGDLKRGGGSMVFPGALAFELHDTYGFPADIAQVIVEEKGFSFDHDGFTRAMEDQKERARRGSTIRGELFAVRGPAPFRTRGVTSTRFLGWDQDVCPAKVAALLRGEEAVDSLESGESGVVILDQTSFYPRGGGQVGDCGALLDSQAKELFAVEDTRTEEGVWFHHGTARGPIRVGDKVEARIDAQARRATEVHHTATHLLHAALKEVLGKHVHQAGSLVAPDRLRFDFTHGRRLTPGEIRAVEERVQREVLAARVVDKRFTTLARAREEGVTALFGEKYGEEVRVVEVPGFSRELCGGTHVQNTGAIGPFLVLGERALAAGVRRIEALAGQAALAVLRREREQLQALERSLKVPAERLLERVEDLRRDVQAAKKRHVSAIPDPRTVARALHEGSRSFPGGPAFAWQRLEGADAGALRSLADKLQKEDGLPGVVLLGGGDPEGLPFVVLCRPDSGFRAGDLARRFGTLVGGGGGGRPDFAQGQGPGTPPAKVEEAVRKLFEALRSAPA
ncbi:MAG: alanine--tRNA ligase-related protein, partial [Planctomycetota bacterium]